jgi:rare lipoprotein A (peptidoglycan hydrolase)
MIQDFTDLCNDLDWHSTASRHYTPARTLTPRGGGLGAGVRYPAFGIMALLGLLCLNMLGCSKEPSRTLQGVASWYGYPHHGRLMASGRRFNMYELTAAHRTLPLQTRLRVTNLSNGRAVTVTITDRGPFVKRRVIDLSYAAAREIGMIGPGTAPVQLEILE